MEDGTETKKAEECVRQLQMAFHECVQKQEELIQQHEQKRTSIHRINAERTRLCHAIDEIHIKKGAIGERRIAAQVHLSSLLVVSFSWTMTGTMDVSVDRDRRSGISRPIPIGSC